MVLLNGDSAPPPVSAHDVPPPPPPPIGPAADYVPDEPDIPQDLLDSLRLLRPVCPRWANRGCKHGMKCKMQHIGVDQPPVPLTQLPFVARHKLEDGPSYIVTRPPLSLAWEKYFEVMRAPVPIYGGHEWVCQDDQKLITYQPRYMDSQKVPEIEAAKR